ncbi:MAG TPA: aldose 1-epimerase family protein, partial [Gaiellaceae bacterium]|nr:aldose 1-epimerase family protein [Gaiellaceae bacterium]
MEASGAQYAIEHGERRAVAVEVGGGLRAYDGVLLGYGADEMARAGRGQVLAPWPNRLEDGSYSFGGQELQLALSEPATRTAIHGLVRFANWTCVAHTADAVTLEHVLHPQPGYPFLLRLRVAYSLDERGLAVETTAENLGDEPAPFGLAHHPYLAGRADDFEVMLPARTKLTVDERKLPVGREPNDLPQTFRVGDLQLDTTFTDLERNEVRVGEHRVWFDGTFRYVQLFTGDHPHVGRKGLAVEPMTCPPNAFRSGEGLAAIRPGETF